MIDEYLSQHAVRYFRAHELASRIVRGGPRTVVPPEPLWARLIPTLHAADLIRERLGAPVRVVSGYRTREYNDLVGGSPTSEHVQCRALDLAADDHEALVRIARDVIDELAARGAATGYGVYDTFVHIDVGSTKAQRRRWDSRSDRG